MAYPEPASKTHVLIDGQNFYLSAEKAFGIRYPNFDARSLADVIAKSVSGRSADSVRFYTGMPVEKWSPIWYEFWTNKLAAMEEDGITTFTRPLRYITETDPQSRTGFRVLSAREKGIDMNIGLDAMELARRSDTANIVIVSRDQDFKEVVDRIDMMCDFERRTIGLWSAYPDDGNGPSHLRGIDGTQEVVIDRRAYAQCIDATDYRGKYAPKRSRTNSPSPA